MGKPSTFAEDISHHLDPSSVVEAENQKSTSSTTGRRRRRRRRQNPYASSTAQYLRRYSNSRWRKEVVPRMNERTNLLPGLHCIVLYLLLKRTGQETGRLHFLALPLSSLSLSLPLRKDVQISTSLSLSPPPSSSKQSRLIQHIITKFLATQAKVSLSHSWYQKVSHICNRGDEKIKNKSYTQRECVYEREGKKRSIKCSRPLLQKESRLKRK